MKCLTDLKNYFMATNKNLFMMVVVVATEIVAGVMRMPVQNGHLR